jgi:hypothetical protein
VLYGHQLPAVGPATPAVAEAARQRLARLVTGHADGLSAAPAATVDVADGALDPVQRDAVSRALNTPDVCLIQGLPGTGKSRVLAEVVYQAAARGQRVLLLGSSAAAIDGALELVARHEVVCAVRCTGPEETPEALPAASRHLTAAERLRQWREVPLQAARQRAEELEQVCRKHRQAETVLGGLPELLSAATRERREQEALRQRALALPDEVARDAGGPSGFAAAVADLELAHRETLATLGQAAAELQERVERARGEHTHTAAALDQLRPLREAREHRRWWTGAWWRALFRPRLAAAYDDLIARRGQTQAALEKLEEEARAFDVQREEAAQKFEADRGRLLHEERARRQAELDAALDECRQRLTALRAEWHAGWRQLGCDGAPPDITPEGAEAVRQAWRTRREEDEQQRAFVHQWIRSLEDFARDLPRRLPEYVNVVASVAGTLAADRYFGDRSPHAADFDLLVWQEAERVTESEFLRLARRARRWVLFGEPSWGQSAQDNRTGDASAPHRSVSTTRRPGGMPQPDLFRRLWHLLHCDPRALRGAWVEEDGRLCCRLRRVAPGQEQWLEREAVADRPDIELRILTLPRTPPALAEVLFPLAVSIADAKRYLYQELGELPVQAASPGLYWTEEPGRVVLHFGGAAPAGAVAVGLEAGVCERVGFVADPGEGHGPAAGSWQTWAIEFDRQAGWDRARAEEWAGRRVGLHDLGRTALLDVPHRMHAALAAVVSDLLGAGGYRVDRAAVSAVGEEADAWVPTARTSWLGLNGQAPRVAFLPVPPPDDGVARRPAEAPLQVAGAVPVSRAAGPALAVPRLAVARPRAAQGGAGFELDLADRRHRDRLPSELRPDLPAQGLVNYLEAQAVIRVLQALADDPALRPASGGGPGAGLLVAVVALYPAQAALLRRLTREVPALAAAGLSVEIGVPAAFREREAQVALLSLTRSHAHRAVTFGDAPEALALALTRARRKLIVVGDPGTLARRCQWEGPLDHLDAAAAEQERGLVARLVRYLQGDGPHQQAFHLCEGGGP